MRPKSLWKRLFKVVWLSLACLPLLVTPPGLARAQDTEMIPFPEAVRLVSQEYIPSASAALRRRGDAELAMLWDQATVGQPFLQYEFASTGAVGQEIAARYLLVPVEYGGELLGLFGIDPHTGEFHWRMDHLSPTAELPKPPGSEQLAAWAGDVGLAAASHSHREVKLLYTAGKNYWYVPGRKARGPEGLFVPLEEPSVLTSLDLEVSPQDPGFVVEPKPLPSSRVAPIGGQQGEAPGYDTAGPHNETSAVAWMVDQVPYYQQDCRLWCWAASLSMMHQWWSPVSLGNSRTQQSEILRFVKGRDVCAGGSADEIHRVVGNWAKVDGMYESFQTTFKGPGKPFEPGIPSGYNNDPKTWLSLEAPVIAFVDTSRTGKANHAILIVGYDDGDTGGVVYIHDPWYSNWWPGQSREPCFALALSYKSFDKKWNTTYEGQFFGAQDAPAAARRRGMVAGIPGDGLLAEVHAPEIGLSGPIRDDEVARVVDVSLGTRNDDSAASQDLFGQSSASGVLIELVDPDQGHISKPVETGDFASSNPEPPSSHIQLQTHSIPEDGLHSGASLHVRPKVTGSIPLRAKWWVRDQDDRRHGDKVISVLDDRVRDDSSFSMKQPILVTDTHGPEILQLEVEDDDLEGPEVTDHDDSGDAEPGTYLFKVRLDDPSGILDNSEYPRIYLRWDSGEIDAMHQDGYVNADWDGSWYVATETVGADKLGHRLYWRVLAYDNDSDWDGDRTETWSPVLEGGIISQSPPLPAPNKVQASDGVYSGEVQITWDSVTGADFYEVYQADAETGPWTRLGSPRDLIYHDTTAKAGAVYYYAVKACNSGGCSSLGGRDRGYPQGVLPPCVVNLLGMGTVGLALLASITRWARKNRVPAVSLLPGRNRIPS